MTKNIDTQINQMLEQVSKKKDQVEQLRKDIPKKWVTNCSLRLPCGKHLNIATLNKEAIIEATMFLIQDAKCYSEAIQALGLDDEYAYEGFSKEEWLEDLKKKLKSLELRDEEVKLNNLEKRLKQIMSEDQKREQELSDIMKDFE